jgi:uncharacterized protein with ATP-grasp and redox domains
MKLTDHCIHCLLSRVRLECSLAGASSGLTAQIAEECRQMLEDCKKSDLIHPQIASRIHRHACLRSGNPDPFKTLKAEGNAQALAVCRHTGKHLVSFRDRVLASVIANIFDYGVKGHTVSSDFSAFFAQEFPQGLAIDHSDAIVRNADRVVYLTDNCGEIVFDRLVVETLKAGGSHVTLAVRDAPILNDATMDDARALGFDRIVDRLTTTGGGAEIGLDRNKMLPDLSDAIDRCTIIIAKGMANYESLSMYEGLPPVAYLMAVKCQPVADDIGIPVGSKIAMLRK